MEGKGKMADVREVFSSFHHLQFPSDSSIHLFHNSCFSTEQNIPQSGAMKEDGLLFPDLLKKQTEVNSQFLEDFRNIIFCTGKYLSYQANQNKVCKDMHAYVSVGSTQYNEICSGVNL